MNSGSRPWTDKRGRRRQFQLNNQPGCADILCVLPGGRFLALEVKRPGNTASDLQRAFLAEVRRRGGLALVCDSLDSLRHQLRAAGYEV